MAQRLAGIDVEVVTKEYEAAHGRLPSGEGSWVFRVAGFGRLAVAGLTTRAFAGVTYTRARQLARHQAVVEARAIGSVSRVVLTVEA